MKRTNDLLRHSHLGIQFALSVVLLAYGGNWLDGRWDFGPLGVLLGVALGFSLGLYQLYREVYGPGGMADGAGSDDRVEGGEDERA